MIETTPLHYRNFIFIYGILSVLMTLEYLEEKEYFEECRKIIEAIKEQEKSLGIKFYYKINEQTIDELSKEYKDLNLDTDFMIGASMCYCKIILNELGVN